MRRVVAASCVVMLGLTASAAATWVGVSKARSGFAETDRARAGVLRYEAVRDAISAEAFAEAGYRRAPGDVTRQRLVDALKAVPAAVAELAASGDATDQGVARQLSVLNTRYADEVRSEMARGSVPPGVSTDDRVAGPALDSMDGLVAAGVAGHRAEARASRERQKRVLSRLAVELPLVFGISILTVAGCCVLIVAQHRRLGRRATVTAWAAEHDELTGLGNRAALWPVLDAALAADEPACGLLLLDLNGFKAVNDTHGHAAGDEVLVATARRLAAAAPAPCLPIRLGGDEFAVFVPSVADLDAVATRLSHDTAQPVILEDGTAITCLPTIGRAAAGPGTDRVELLRTADLDMYQGKPRRTQPTVTLPGPRHVTPVMTVPNAAASTAQPAETPTETPAPIQARR